MKTFVSAKIEGISGISGLSGMTDRAEADLSQPDNVELRQRMTAEVVAACERAIAADDAQLVKLNPEKL